MKNYPGQFLVVPLLLMVPSLAFAHGGELVFLWYIYIAWYILLTLTSVFIILFLKVRFPIALFHLLISLFLYSWLVKALPVRTEADMFAILGLLPIGIYLSLFLLLFAMHKKGIISIKRQV